MKRAAPDEDPLDREIDFSNARRVAAPRKKTRA